MTQHDFKRELYECRNGMGFQRGSRVLVDDKVGTVTVRRVCGSNNVRHTVKFDDGTCGVYAANDMAEAVRPEGQPTEVDLLGQRIRRT